MSNEFIVVTVTARYNKRLTKHGMAGRLGWHAGFRLCLRVRVWQDGTMMLEDLTPLRPAIAELCAQYGVVELWVFGSTVRGDSGVDSDVDLLYVRGTNAARGLAFFGLQGDLESLLGRPVDLVPKDGLHWVIKDRVLHDAEVLYAA